MKQDRELHRGLKNRHLQMIALGGAVGTGLFYGSVETISMAGPSVILSYLIGGAVIFLIMRMLGEMVVEEPVAGSFSYYAAKYWGAFPGFLIGWNYWFNYIIVSMAELMAVAIYMNFWYPDLPQWMSILACLAMITLVNLVNVGLYGEVEFWMALVKVAAILCMIILGVFLIFSSPADFPENLANLWNHGGFFPHGIWGMVLAIALVMFSFGGLELVGIAAGEADEPERSIPKAINQVIWRILVFYVGTMAVLTTLWPWNMVGREASPFVQIFVNIGIPAAANILNFVVLMAAVSVYNSGIYSNSRMLYRLAEDGHAPAFLRRVSYHGVPVAGILVSSAITLLAVLLDYLFPAHAFVYMVSIATCSAVITWVSIAITHMKFRKACRARGKTAKFQALAYPFGNYFCLAFFAGIVLLMAQIPEMQMAVMVLPVWVAILWIGFCCRKKGNR